jgi:hypothetical protein
MEQPADVDRELVCLGPRQQHADIQGFKETALVDPTTPLHELPVHQSDLSGWPTEAE